MSKVKLYSLFHENWLEYNKDNIEKYKKGWTISEIKQGKEYYHENYKKNTF
jgi:hypothetical protein